MKALHNGITPKRSIALDALRGLAIIGMVLSGTIAHTMPSWMYHAQLGPRSEFRFDPSIYGITWVDLVFPFFLFAMGAAFPLAMGKRKRSGESFTSIIAPLLKRAFLLVMFAVSIYYCSPYRLGHVWTSYLSAVLAFLFWFVAFVRIPDRTTQVNSYINWVGYILIGALVAFNVLSYPDLFQSGFLLSNNDIIILVLANMALFGGIIWWLTATNWYVRLGVMALYFVLRITAGVQGSWNAELFSFNPLQWLPVEVTSILYRPGAWLFQMGFLKYLFIIIPGTIAGDLIADWMRSTTDEAKGRWTKWHYVSLAALCFTLLVGNLCGWYMRWLLPTALFNVCCIAVGYILVCKPTCSLEQLYRRLWSWGSFWLLLGTLFEAYEGGIRKDDATMSYFFLTSGLAIATYIFFSIISDCFHRSWFSYISDAGKNPMVAYVAGTFVVVPMLYFTGILPLISELTQYGAWWGLAKGVVITTGTVAIAVYTVRHRWFWKT